MQDYAPVGSHIDQKLASVIRSALRLKGLKTEKNLGGKDTIMTK